MVSYFLKNNAKTDLLLWLSIRRPIAVYNPVPKWHVLTIRSRELTRPHSGEHDQTKLAMQHHFSPIHPRLLWRGRFKLGLVTSSCSCQTV